jgi:hypothetical protein
LKRQSRPKKDKLAEDGKKLHNEQIHNLPSSQNINGMIKLRRMRWDGHVARMVKIINSQRIFVRKSEEKRLHGIPRRR